jgi:hypothetical protein
VINLFPKSQPGGIECLAHRAGSSMVVSNISLTGPAR